MNNTTAIIVQPVPQISHASVGVFIFQVLASTNNHSGGDSGALWPSAFVDDVDHRWRQNTNDTEGPADVEPADEYAVKKICPQCSEYKLAETTTTRKNQIQKLIVPTHL